MFYQVEDIRSAPTHRAKIRLKFQTEFLKPPKLPEPSFDQERLQLIVSRQEMGQLFSRQIALSPAGYGTWQFGSKGADDYWGFTCDQELANALFVNPCASQEHRRNVQEMPRVLGAWMCFESSRSSRKRKGWPGINLLRIDALSSG